MSSDIHLSLLDRVHIASPCPAKWEDMAGDHVTRHCSQCDLDVHNLSAMTREQAESFLREHLGGDRVCGRIFRRSDGTILTKDCPVGLAAVRARARRAAGRVAAAIFAIISAAAFAHARGADEDRWFIGSDSVRDFDAIDRFVGWIRPSTRSRVPQGQWLGGVIAWPPPNQSGGTGGCESPDAPSDDQ